MPTSEKLFRICEKNSTLGLCADSESGYQCFKDKNIHTILISINIPEVYIGELYLTQKSVSKNFTTYKLLVIIAFHSLCKDLQT